MQLQTQVSPPKPEIRWGNRQRLVVGLALLGFFGTAARAVADNVVALHHGAVTSLTSVRDPDLFLQDMAPVLPPPVVLLTREDAVAQEILSNSPTLSQAQALRTAQALCEEARSLGYDPLLFLAVIHIESFYNHLAISPVGAEGLMQLMPGTAEFMAERGKMPWPDNHSFDPVLNVRLGVRYLVELHREFHLRMDHALTAYNRGPHNTHYILTNYGELPDAVRDFYAGKVLDRYHTLVAAYGHLPLS
jgi:soluble lytic murein transglycosylase-like protein